MLRIGLNRREGISVLYSIIQKDPLHAVLEARASELLLSSIVIAGFTVALILIVASMAAFAFAHLHFFGRDFLFNYLLLGLTFPFATAILPLFIKVRDKPLRNGFPDQVRA